MTTSVFNWELILSKNYGYVHTEPKEQLFSPAFSAQQLFQVIEKLKTEDSGNLFAWDGERIDF